MTLMTRLTSRIAGAGLAAAAVIALGIATAEARPGGGGSFGSRGGRTFSAPPVTTTAPRSAAPIERSMTQPSQPSPGYSAPANGAPRPGLFGRPGFGTGLLGGLLGAGVLGMLFGHGMFGGIGGILSFFGMLLQFALIAGLVMLALRFFRSRNQPAMAGAYARNGAGMGGGPVPGGASPGGLGSALGGLGGSRGPAAPEPPRQPVDAVGIGPADYQAFESRLQAVNAAWDREDTAALRTLCTPEMVAYFGEDLARNQGRGLHDRVRDVRLLQGDLAESWREGPVDYATVAMRFSLVNALVERATGKLVEGDADRPQEVTELWTFRRERGQDWQLSAIQQA
jgi:predicted lipid-binding transport protein (Tim44 family)